MIEIKIINDYEAIAPNDNLRINDKSLYYHILKRIIDLCGSVIGMIIFAPLMLITMLAIKIDSKGPAIFSQERVGRAHKTFKMYKFRSMKLNAEEEKHLLIDRNEMSGPMFKIKEDPRITKIGKLIRCTSIDELPQLINVLKGEMSLVGPRPSLPSEVSKFEKWMLKRLEVKPGLTCYWQVRGRNEIGFIDWMELDCKYVDERNTFVDILLIFKTFKKFLGDKHAR